MSAKPSATLEPRSPDRDYRPRGRETAAPGKQSEPSVCQHCGTPFTPIEGRSTEFCCAGCEYVYRLITGQKLDRFYALRDRVSAPVRPVVFQPRDYRWLVGLVQRAETDARTRGVADASLDLDLQGISCVACVWLIDRVFRETPGARDIRVNASMGRVTLRWEPGACDVAGFAGELQRFGYLLGPATKAARSESGGLVLRLGLCAAFAMNGMLFSLPAYLGMAADFPFARLFTTLAFVFASLSVALGGSYFFNRSWRSLRRGVLHIDLPISLGILVSYAGSIWAWTQAHGGFVYFDFVSTFTFLMLVGRWTQLVAVERNRNQLLGLNQELPPVELISDAGPPAPASSPSVHASAGAGAPAKHSVASKPAEALVPGDRFAVEPGQIIPVSSALLGPAGSLGLDWINGESDARAALPGQIVASGAINLSPHALRLEALENWPRSLLARLLAVRPASEWRNLQLERVIRVYLLAVLAIAFVGGAAWFFATRDLTATLQVVVSVLVVSCPCATGVTLPLIDEIVVARLRRAGVFVRSESLWARLRRVRKVIFDKTGTLTLESLGLRNPETLSALSETALAALWVLVKSARHPVAACLREALLSRGLAPADAAHASAQAREEVGAGLEWRDTEGLVWRLGRAPWAGPAVASTAEGAGTLFSCNGCALAAFATVEEVRDDAIAEVARLRAGGHEVFILSGDRREKVAAMAARLQLPPESAAAEMTPADKADWVRQHDEHDTLMIGDGANDSLAFDAALCRGTPAVERGVLEHRSDFYFLGRGLAGITRLFAAERRRRRGIHSVLTFTVAYNIVVIAVSLAGWMSPLIAAVVMPASALVSIGIAMLALRERAGR